MRRWGAWVLSAALAVQAAANGPRIEISADGRTVVAVQPQATDGQVLRTGRAVPYGSTPGWQCPLRRQVGGVVIADVNNDGWNDLVAGCYQSNSYPPYTDWENMIFMNTAGVLETMPSWVSSDEVSTGDVEVADFNGDGYLDVFAGNGGSAMSPSVIYWGSAAGPSETPGWYSAAPAGAWVTDAAVCDFDRDGDPDVATSNQSSITTDPFRPAYVYLNNGTTLGTVPGWASAQASIQSWIAFGDYNNDGWEDLTVSEWDNNFQSGIYRNDHGLLDTTKIWSVGFSDTDKGVAWADVDGNGWLDLAIGHDPTLLYTNNGGVLTQTWAAQGAYFGQQDLKFADLDRDGYPELGEVHFSNGKTQIYANVGGTLTFTPAWVYDAAGSGTALAFGDLNGDLWLDLAIGLSGEPCLVVFYATGPYVIGDLDCDGALEFGDINPFVLALANPELYTQYFPGCDLLHGDINGDGAVDFGDINAFVRQLSR